jgi:hypothetical protein
MQSIDKHHQNTELTSILTVFEVVSMLGLIYCLLVLAGLQIAQHMPVYQLLLYGGWFALSAVCVFAMLRQRKWGAYGLAIATLIVTVVDIRQGTATFGGACLGLVIAILIVDYLTTRVE